MSKFKLTLIILTSAILGIILFIAVFYGYSYLKFKEFGANQNQILPAETKEKDSTGRYLGILGVSSGKFDWDNQTQLSSGRGKIKGHILKDGRPCSGLKIQLFLSGKNISESAESGVNGEYLIHLPVGEYELEGWQIDLESANKVLDGKILEPGLHYTSQKIAVSESNITQGPSLNFIDPINILKPQGIINYSDDIIFEWSPVDGSTAYRIQIIDRGENLRGTQYKPIFKPYKERPTTPNNIISTSKMGIKLNQGHYYTLEVEALNDTNQTITETPKRHEDGFFIQKQ